LSIGDLVATMRLDASKFDSGVVKTQSSMKRLSGSIGNIGGAVNALNGIWSKLAAFTGVGAFGFMTGEAMKLVDETGELAQSLGITTEALTGLRHAALLGGSSAEGLDASLRKMLTNIGDARAGTGTMIGLLDRFGVTADQLAQQDPASVFSQLAQKISELPLAADQASAALRIFGRAGVEMLPMLQQGSSGINAMLADAKRLGMTFSDFDSSQVAAANDAIDRMRGSVTALFNSVAIGAAPAITSMVNVMTEGIAFVKPMWQDMFTGISLGWTSTADTAALSGVNMWKTMATVVPEMSGLFEGLYMRGGAGIVALQDSWSSFYQFIRGGLIEYYNLWVARIAGINELMNTLDFSKAQDRFEKVLASQVNQAAANPASIFAGAYSRTLEELQAMTRQSGGFVNHLESEVGRLSEKIAASNASLFNMSRGQFQLAADLGLNSIASGVNASSSGRNGGPAKALVGSSEAYKLINSANFAQKDASERLLDRQLSAAKKTNELLSQVVYELRNPPKEVEIEIP
jgi:hypothetical protein